MCLEVAGDCVHSFCYGNIFFVDFLQRIYFEFWFVFFVCFHMSDLLIISCILTTGCGDSLFVQYVKVCAFIFYCSILCKQFVSQVCVYVSVLCLVFHQGGDFPFPFFFPSLSSPPPLCFLPISFLLLCLPFPCVLPTFPMSGAELVNGRSWGITHRKFLKVSV